MRTSRVFLVIATPLVLGVLGIYEAQYSADMQAHIDRINHQLMAAEIRSIGSSGLLGSLQEMTDEADIAGEIMDTHLYVHTVRDELLARKIRKAAEDGVTVGGAMQNVIQAWPKERSGSD